MDAMQFEQQLREQGYGDPGPLEYPPHTIREMHAHDRSVSVPVPGGELTLVGEGGSTTCEPGDVCQIPAGTLHAEQTGSSGLKAVLGKQ